MDQPSFPAPSPQLDPDQVMVDRIKGGDQSAVEEIIRRYRPRIYYTTFQLLHDRQDAEEITQDAFIYACRGLARFRGDSTFSTWLYRIALNLTRNRYHYWVNRRRDRQVSLEAPLDAESETTLRHVIAAESDSAYGTIDHHELLDQIRAGLNRISSKHREILILRNAEDLSYERISQILGISIGTVKSRICRAREELRAVVMT